MTRASVAEVLREVRQELPVGIRRAYEDGVIGEYEAWRALERLLGSAELMRLLESREVDLREVDRAVLAYRRRRTSGEGSPGFEVPEGVAA